MTPSLLGVMAFAGVPFIVLCRRSFLDARGERFCGLENYMMVLQSKVFQRASWNTLRFMGVCIPVVLGISFLLAFLIYIGLNAEKQKSVVKLGYLLPYVLPVASFVVIWRLIFERNGLVNAGLITLANALEIDYERIDWMRSEYAFWVLCLCYIWRQVGFYMVLWIAGIESIDIAVFEAAKIDGVSRYRLAKDIVLPNVKGTFHMLVIMALTGCFKCYREAYLVAGDYPDKSMYMLQHVFTNWFATLDIQKMSAGTVIMVLILVLVLGARHGKEE